MAILNATSIPDDGKLVQIASYNTNLQGRQGIPQDLVDWLSPAPQVSSVSSSETGKRAPDIIAVGFQELVPLHLGLLGWSKSVIDDWNKLIMSQIEQYSPNNERYSLVAKVVNVGVALLVYGRDDRIARKVCDVQTQWTGFGPGYMGTKGAVGVRFRIPEDDGELGEVYTFVNAHLTAWEDKLEQRIADYHYILASLTFPPIPGYPSSLSSIFDTSHLFFLGDLNFRVVIPENHPLSMAANSAGVSETLRLDRSLKDLKEYDQLTIEKRKGTVFSGLREGEFWRFKCTYKYELGKVDEYRSPSWTDRILYTTFTDSPRTPEESNIKNLLYTSIPSCTTSDHKPIISLLYIPRSGFMVKGSSVPILQVSYENAAILDRNADMQRFVGRFLDRFVGIMWCFMTTLGAGSGLFGLFNFFLGLSAWTWWKVKSNYIDV